MMPFKQRSEGIKELSHVKMWRERQLSAGLQSRILLCVFRDCREATVTSGAKQREKGGLRGHREAWGQAG